MAEKYDYLFKIILLGDSSVGKTSILLRFSENTYNSDFHSTIGVDFRVSLQHYNDKLIKLQLWDTAGQERFRNIVSSYYRIAHAALFIFDITNSTSFENVSK
jgi:small GTP-binding protein domain